MKPDSLYNYSTNSVSVGGFMLPPGGPYLIPAGLAGEGTESQTVIVNSLGETEFHDFYQTYSENYFDGFSVGVTIAGCMLTIYIVKLLRRAS